ncbi:MAG: 2-C-methyl-D-erythritol 4-phosphate cytidylyltransferase [Candidatus Aminicenantales bacterium]
MNDVTTIVVAAGEGRRFGTLKQFALLKGKPILDWCLEKFEAHVEVDEVILVLPDLRQRQRYMNRYSKISAVVKGGEKRQDSVWEGFRRIDPKKTEIVLIHDGVRPLVSPKTIHRVIEGARKKQAVVPGLVLDETVKEVKEQAVVRTLERERLVRIQTPQAFLYSLLKRSFQKAADEHYYGTDEASLVERLGEKVFILPGDPRNIKITSPLDLRVAEALLED